MCCEDLENARAERAEKEAKIEYKKVVKRPAQATQDVAESAGVVQEQTHQSRGPRCGKPAGQRLRSMRSFQYHGKPRWPECGSGVR